MICLISAIVYRNDYFDLNWPTNHVEDLSFTGGKLRLSTGGGSFRVNARFHSVAIGLICADNTLLI